MKTIRLAGLALLTCVASCSDLFAPGRTVSDLESARVRWRAQGLHTYAVTIQSSCFCVRVNPLYVVVVSDTVAGVLDTRTGEWIDRKFGKTVEGLFDFIEDATDRHAYSIRATYDPARGFPTAIDYDGAMQIADDELFYRVSDVHAVTPQR